MEYVNSSSFAFLPNYPWMGYVSFWEGNSFSSMEKHQKKKLIQTFLSHDTQHWGELNPSAPDVAPQQLQNFVRRRRCFPFVEVSGELVQMICGKYGIYTFLNMMCVRYDSFYIYIYTCSLCIQCQWYVLMCVYYISYLYWILCRYYLHVYIHI